VRRARVGRAYQEQGQAELAYVLVTAFLSVVVFRPDLLAAVAYQAADLFQLFLMQLEAVF